jgi:hypothetical protein
VALSGISYRPPLRLGVLPIAEAEARVDALGRNPEKPAADDELIVQVAGERVQITTQLREISEYVRSTYDLPVPQQTALDARLDYLEAAAARGLGRIDWRNAFVGVMMGVVVEAILPPDVAREALALALRGLAHLFGLPQLPAG